MSSALNITSKNPVLQSLPCLSGPIYSMKGQSLSPNFLRETTSNRHQSLHCVHTCCFIAHASTVRINWCKNSKIPKLNMPFALKTHSFFTSRISHLWAEFKAFNIYSYIPFTVPYQNRKYPVLFYKCLSYLPVMVLD